MIDPIASLYGLCFQSLYQKSDQELTPLSTFTLILTHFVTLTECPCNTCGNIFKVSAKTDGGLSISCCAIPCHILVGCYLMQKLKKVIWIKWSGIRIFPGFWREMVDSICHIHAADALSKSFMSLINQDWGCYEI